MVLLENLGLSGVMLMVLFFGKMVMDIVLSVFYGKNADQELTMADNPAFGISFVGYLGGLTIATLTGITTSGSSYFTDITIIMIHGVFAVVALLLARFVNDFAVLYQVSNTAEIFEEKNVGIGMVEAGSFLATSFILAGSWSSGGWGAVCLWFLIGQLMLVLTALFYQKILPYDLHKEIDEGNLACALGLAGFLLAVGWVIWEAMSGPVTTFTADLFGVGIYLVIALVVLAVVRLVTDWVFLPGTTLKEEIGQRNINAGLLEAAMYIISAAAFTVFV